MRSRALVIKLSIALFLAVLLSGCIKTDVSLIKPADRVYVGERFSFLDKDKQLHVYSHVGQSLYENKEGSHQGNVSFFLLAKNKNESFLLTEDKNSDSKLFYYSVTKLVGNKLSALMEEGYCSDSFVGAITTAIKLTSCKPNDFLSASLPSISSLPRNDLFCWMKEIALTKTNYGAPLDVEGLEVSAVNKSQVTFTCNSAKPTATYSVDGLALGGKVVFGSAEYQQYNCSHSEQFAGFTWCQRQLLKSEPRGQYTSTNSVLHTDDGTAVYVNRSLQPAFFAENEATQDVDRLSKSYGIAPRIIPIPQNSSMPNGMIALWGNVVLEPLSTNSINELAAGRDVKDGFLIDFIGDFHRSARLGLPVYALRGGAGYVWAASWDRSGTGALRFAALDASAFMPSAATEAKSSQRIIPPQQSPLNNAVSSVAQQSNSPPASQSEQGRSEGSDTIVFIALFFGGLIGLLMLINGKKKTSRLDAARKEQNTSPSSALFSWQKTASASATNKTSTQQDDFISGYSAVDLPLDIATSQSRKETLASAPAEAHAVAAMPASINADSLDKVVGPEIVAVQADVSKTAAITPVTTSQETFDQTPDPHEMRVPKASASETVTSNSESRQTEQQKAIDAPALAMEGGLVDQIAKLAKLHADGALTDEEFKKLKSKLVESGTNTLDQRLKAAIAPEVDRLGKLAGTIKEEFAPKVDAMRQSTTEARSVIKSKVGIVPVAVGVGIVAVVGGIWGLSGGVPDCDDQAVKKQFGNSLNERANRLNSTGVQINMAFNNIRERHYDNNVKKRYCATFVKAEEMKIPENSFLRLADPKIYTDALQGDVNYSVQYTQNGSLYVNLGE